MNPRLPSLRRRLLVLLLSGSLIFWALVAAISYRNAHHEVDELFDVQMSQVAHTLLAIALADQDSDLKPGTPWPHRPGGTSHRPLPEAQKLMFQLRDGAGKLLLRSPNAPDTPLVARDGFSEVEDAVGHWRYFAIRDEGGRFQVQVGEDHSIRDELVARTVMQFMWPILLGTPFLALWVWLATGQALRPLAQLRQDLDLRGADHLVRLPATAIPEEVAPLVATLNRLLGEVEGALEQERRFTSDAAHELRTPLAALQAQLHVARNARDDRERQHALGQLEQGLGRAGRLVEQMLQLARLDPERSLPDRCVVDLGALAREVCAGQGPAALNRNLDFALEAEVPVPVDGTPDWLRVLLRNLVDNGIRYTPEGGRVLVSVTLAGDGGAILRVADSGPGIPPEQRAAALQRFHRLENSGSPGHGLGLSIVSRIAELHGARLILDRDPALGGLKAEVVFPPGVPEKIR